MIGAIPRICTLLAVIGVGACGHGLEDEEPPRPPTSAELSRFIAETEPPAYWLGRRFRGLTVSHASVGRSVVGITYGPWSCDPGSGCSDGGGIWTQRRSIDELATDPYDSDPVFHPRKCWRRVGKAVAVLSGCDPHGYPQELVVYTGADEIYLTSMATADGQGEIPVRTVVKGLRPLNARAAWPLPPPARLSCRQFSRVRRDYRRHMPQRLRPLAQC